MRIDKWLYYVRLYKTRIESNYACGNGYVLINKLVLISTVYNRSKLEQKSVISRYSLANNGKDINEAKRDAKSNFIKWVSP